MTTTSKIYPWLMLGVFSLMFFVITAATFTSLGVVLPSMVSELGWDWTTAGLGFTLLGISCGIFSFLPAITIRRYGLRVTIFIGTAICVIGFLALYETNSIFLYLLGTTLVGTGFSFVATVPGTYVLARVFERQSMAFGIYFTIGGLGGIVGPLIYFVAMNVWDQWRMHWLMVAVATAAAGLLIMLVSREDTRDHTNAIAEAEADEEAAEEALPLPPEIVSKVYVTNEVWTVAEALRTPQFYVISMGYVSFLLCGITVNSLSVGHLTQNGVAAGIAALMLSVESLINSGARAGSGIIGEFFEPKSLLVISLLALVIGMVTLSYATTLPFLIIYALGIGIGYGMTFLATSILILNYYGRGPYLELFSLMNVAATLASIGPFGGGYMRDLFGSFVPGFLIFAAVPFCVMIAVLFMRPPRRRDQTTESTNTSPGDNGPSLVAAEAGQS